jgi:DNA-binding transcriptional ArsR family regulator
VSLTVGFVGRYRTWMEVIRSASRAATLLDDTRRAIVEHLTDAPDSATGIARKLGLPRQRINYHLRTLEKVGFVELVEERKKGNCVERLVRATARSFLISPEALGALGVDPGGAVDRYSAAYLMAAASRVIRDLALITGKARADGKRVATLTLETEIRFRNATERQGFTEELGNIVAQLAAKYHEEQAAGGRRFRIVLGAYPAVTKPDLIASERRRHPQ